MNGVPCANNGGRTMSTAHGEFWALSGWMVLYKCTSLSLPSHINHVVGKYEVLCFKRKKKSVSFP